MSVKDAMFYLSLAGLVLIIFWNPLMHLLYRINPDWYINLAEFFAPAKSGNDKNDKKE